MKRGDKVNLRLRADVIAIREREPKFMIQLLPYGAAAPVGLHVSTDEIVDPSADWRDVCADMIRLGRDRDAIALLTTKANSAESELVTESPVGYVLRVVERMGRFADLDPSIWRVGSFLRWRHNDYGGWGFESAASIDDATIFENGNLAQDRAVSQRRAHPLIKIEVVELLTGRPLT